MELTLDNLKKISGKIQMTQHELSLSSLIINVIKVPISLAKFWPDFYGWVDIKGGEEKEGKKKQNTKGRMTKAVLASSIVFFPILY